MVPPRIRRDLRRLVLRDLRQKARLVRLPLVALQPFLDAQRLRVGRLWVRQCDRLMRFR